MKIINRRKVLDISFIIFLSVIFSWYLLTNGSSYYRGDDLTFHLYRIVGIADAFKDGQIIPRIYPLANYGYGYIAPLFYCDLFLYPFGLLYLLGYPLMIVYKLLIVILTIITTYIVFFISKKVFDKEITPYLVSVLYVLSNYRIFDMYYRAALGELISFAIVPLVIYSIYKILYLEEDDYLLLGVSFSLLVMCHMLTSFLYACLFLIFIILYIIKNIRDIAKIKKRIICILKGTAIGIGLCLWILLPMLEQLRNQEFYLNYISNFFNINDSTQTIIEVFYPFANKVSVGLMLLLIPILYIKTKKNKLINILFAALTICVFLVLGIIEYPKSFDVIQFLFRLYIIITPFLCVISGYVVDNMNRKVIVCLFVVISCLSIANLFFTFKCLENNNRKIDINNEIVLFSYDGPLDYNWNELGGGEYLPTCNNNNYINDEIEIRIENVDGVYLYGLKDYDRYLSNISFNYDGPNGFASLPITYYKGYSVYCDSAEVLCVNDELFKRVGFYLESGKHNYCVKYNGTRIQSFSVMFSLLSLAFVFVLKIKNIFTMAKRMLR